MKKLFFNVLVCLFLFGCASNSPVKSERADNVVWVKARGSLSFSRDAVLTRLLAISSDSKQSLSIKESDKEFSVNLPSDAPQGNEKQEWYSAHVTVYYKNLPKLTRL